MLYEYLCPQCDVTTDVVKPMSDYASKEFCVVCNSELMKLFRTINAFPRGNEWPEYNPAFGEVIKNKYHRGEEAKKRDWIEIGNENPDNIAKKFEKEREQKMQKRWDDTHIQGIG